MRKGHTSSCGEVWCREKRSRVAEETKKTNALSHCCGTQAKFKVPRTPQDLGWVQDFSQVLGVLFWTCRVACLHIPDHQRAYESPNAGRAGRRPLFLPFLLLATESPHFCWEHDLSFKRYISWYPLQIVVLQISCQWMWTEGTCATSRTYSQVRWECSASCLFFFASSPRVGIWAWCRQTSFNHMGRNHIL